MTKKYVVKQVVNGIATVLHKCWFCNSKYTAEYPLDDVGMKCRVKKLCLKCEMDLDKFKKSNPKFC